MKSKVRHVAIIMDGNGRWAQSRKLPRVEGHKAGAEAVRRAIQAAKDTGVEYLTLYAFSTENWKRPKEEINTLFQLLCTFLKNNRTILRKNQIRLRVIGRINELPLYTRTFLRKILKETEKNTNAQLILALNYGGRAEIVDAMKSIANDVVTGKISAEKINEETISSYLYAPDLPDPDIIIRTSGEFRVSNFLLWEMSYSEIIILETLWPDFTEKDFFDSLEIYNKRRRRFGGM